MSTIFDTRLFAATLRTRRNERGLRDISTETGVSVSILSRIESGEMPDMETFLTLCSWAGWPVGVFLNAGKDQDTGQIAEQALYEDGIPTTETIGTSQHQQKILFSQPSESQAIHKSEEERATEKVTAYFTVPQYDHIDELRQQYRQRTKQRISVNALLRRLVERATIEDILGN